MIWWSVSAKQWSTVNVITCEQKKVNIIIIILTYSEEVTDTHNEFSFRISNIEDVKAIVAFLPLSAVGTNYMLNFKN